MDNTLDRNQMWSPPLTRPYQIQGHTDFLLAAQHAPSSSAVTRRNQPGAPTSQIQLEEHQPSYARPHIPPFPQHHRYLPETQQLHTHHPQFQQRRPYGVPQLPPDPRDNTPGPSHTSAEEDAEEYTNGHGIDGDSTISESHDRDPRPGAGPDPPLDEEPLYVNAKQYNRILKRRIARARLEELHRLSKQRKPYLHESRHKHAMRRPRGPGGRFLTAEEIAAQQKAAELSDPSTFQNPNPSAEERKALKASESAAVASSSDPSRSNFVDPIHDVLSNNAASTTTAGTEFQGFVDSASTSAAPAPEPYPQSQAAGTQMQFLDVAAGPVSSSSGQLQ